jgi:diadenosine tetraphosphate (Ap4A) HIT family hydrolase/5-methylcytosine-specific restriction endonuclease McrA
MNIENTYAKLENFIRFRMKMSHIYQPIMLINLLKNDGKSSVEKIAKSLLVQDQSQIEYYEQITKNMVGKVLSDNNEITARIKDGSRIEGFYIPGYETLSSREVKSLIELCESKIKEFINARGSNIWDHRRRSSGYISGTLQYEVLKRAKFRCELCGIMDADKALQVDHILPRNHGGKDEIINLQALCYSCNAMKRDRDATDFRGVSESYNIRKKDCIFCSIDESRIISSNSLAYVIRDKFPVTEYHTLIIPKRHTSSMFDLYQPELNAIYFLIKEQKDKILELDKSVSGFNVGVNDGEFAGQTIFHCHFHLIPRRKGDADNPRGGIRGVIEGKSKY